MTVYKGENMNQIISLILMPNVPELVLITHDESIFYANDGVVKTWGPQKKTSFGASHKVSVFM